VISSFTRRLAHEILRGMKKNFQPLLALGFFSVPFHPRRHPKVGGVKATLRKVFKVKNCRTFSVCWRLGKMWLAASNGCFRLPGWSRCSGMWCESFRNRRERIHPSPITRISLQVGLDTAQELV